MATANDVAAYLVLKLKRTDTMKLQKLLYYSQGWSLAWDGVPLFDDRIEAWANGPVVPSVFRNHKGRFVVTDWSAFGDAKTLTKSEQETVDVVLRHYGKSTGQALADLTHTERPWLEARASTPLGHSSKAEVKKDTMQDFFGGLASS